MKRRLSRGRRQRHDATASSDVSGQTGGRSSSTTAAADPPEVVDAPPLEVGVVTDPLAARDGTPSWEARGAERRRWWQEVVRAQLAALFTLIFIGTVAYACWAATTSHWRNAKELIQILLPAETALIGSATGFYFGSRGASRD